MVKLVSRICRFMDKALTAWCVLIMALMSVLVILSVIFRYVFNLSYVWSEELIVFLFITTTYFGAILCVHENEHIDISFLRDNLKGQTRETVIILVNLICIVVQVALAFISLEWIRKTGSSITIGLKIPYTYIYAMFPVCFISMAFYQARKIVNILLNRQNEPEGEE